MVAAIEDNLWALRELLKYKPELDNDLVSSQSLLEVAIQKRADAMLNDLLHHPPVIDLYSQSKEPEWLVTIALYSTQGMLKPFSNAFEGTIDPARYGHLIYYAVEIARLRRDENAYWA